MIKTPIGKFKSDKDLDLKFIEKNTVYKQKVLVVDAIYDRTEIPVKDIKHIALTMFYEFIIITYNGITFKFRVKHDAEKLFDWLHKETGLIEQEKKLRTEDELC